MFATQMDPNASVTAIGAASGPSGSRLARDAPSVVAAGVGATVGLGDDVDDGDALTLGVGTVAGPGPG
jgi:hypothetical protein